MSKYKGDSLGDRMKAYENCYRIYLPKRSAVVVRIDVAPFIALHTIWDERLTPEAAKYFDIESINKDKLV